MRNLIGSKMAALVMTLAVAACGARPVVPTTPAQRAQAVTLVLHGGTVHDVASELAISDADARRVVRATTRELMQWLQGARQGRP